MADKILIAEDDFANGIAALVAMKELGFDAILVSNAEDGKEALDNDDFLAVLADMNMPLKKGGSIDRKAGRVIIKKCINQCVPSAIVTGGGIGHHGVPCVKILLPKPMFAVDPVEEFSLNNTREIDSGDDKNIEVWKQAWSILKDIADPCILQARKKHRKRFGYSFQRG